VRRLDTKLEIADGIALITLDRSQHLNAFTGAMGRQLEAGYRACDENDAVRVVILTGALVVGLATADDEKS